MKRAFLIGIDEYDSFRSLAGCVNDVNELSALLERNDDGSPNFECRTITSEAGRVERRDVLEAVDQLLAPGADVALFYFAGHGDSAENDVVLVSQDGIRGDPGLLLSVLLGKVKNSKIGEVVIVLDCCFAGGAGGMPQLGDNVAVIRDGVTLVAASRSDQPAAELPIGRGAFSYYLCGALEGGAADVLGQVTLAGVYAYLSESFGAFDQRPTFKANVDRFHELRSCSPAVPLDELRQLPKLFPSPDTDLQLDPSYEPSEEPRHAENEKQFAILQRCRAAKLVEPVGAEHLYFAAVESKACRLTPLGKHYRHLASKSRL